MATRLCCRAFLATSIPHLFILPTITSFTPQFTQLNMSSSTTTNEQKSYIDKLALVLINSKHQQLVARSYGKEVFYTPGGKRELGETDIQALVRECIEELATDLLTSTKTPANIEPYGVFEAQAYGKPEGTMVRMQCYRVTPVEAELELERLVKASEEVEELAWIDSSFDRSKLTVTGKCAFVLFYHIMNSSVQYEVSAIWILHLVIICLCLIAFKPNILTKDTISSLSSS